MDYNSNNNNDIMQDISRYFQKSKEGLQLAEKAVQEATKIEGNRSLSAGIKRNG